MLHSAKIEALNRQIDLALTSYEVLLVLSEMLGKKGRPKHHREYAKACRAEMRRRVKATERSAIQALKAVMKNEERRRKMH
jgi:hypothetical protein